MAGRNPRRVIARIARIGGWRLTSRKDGNLARQLSLESWVVLMDASTALRTERVRLPYLPQGSRAMPQTRGILIGLRSNIACEVHEIVLATGIRRGGEIGSRWGSCTPNQVTVNKKAELRNRLNKIPDECWFESGPLYNLTNAIYQQGVAGRSTSPALTTERRPRHGPTLQCNRHHWTLSVKIAVTGQKPI